MHRSVRIFMLGTTVGLAVAFFVVDITSLARVSNQQKLKRSPGSKGVSNIEEKEQPAVKQILKHGDLDIIQRIIKPPTIGDNETRHEANALAKKVRILCWIMTSPQNLDKKAQHVKKTWGKRCTILLFISSVTNDSFPTIGVNTTEGREHLTAKTMLAFRYVYEHYFDKADWFMKTDDDTFVILENLRYFLSGENPDDPVYFGHHFKTNVKQGYLSGGAGYTISKEALSRFGKFAKNSSICRQDGGSEDVEFGRCMENLGVKVGNSTDTFGRSRFHCFNLELHLLGGYPKWYYSYDSHGAKTGQESISVYPISFHYVHPRMMNALEFSIYHMGAYGIRWHHHEINQKKMPSWYTPSLAVRPIQDVN